MRTPAILALVAATMSLVLAACVSLGEGQTGSQTSYTPTWSSGKAVALVASVVQASERERVNTEAKSTFDAKQGFWEVVWEGTIQGKGRRATWRVYERNSTVVPWDDGAKSITPVTPAKST